jgi:hypothetical protein
MHARIVSIIEITKLQIGSGKAKTYRQPDIAGAVCALISAFDHLSEIAAE